MTTPTQLPTPETDNLICQMMVFVDDQQNFQQIINLARKLERERDEARNEIAHRNTVSDSDAIATQQLLVERDQLRKVADELAERIKRVRPIVREEDSKEDWLDCHLDKCFTTTTNSHTSLKGTNQNENSKFATMPFMHFNSC